MKINNINDVLTYPENYDNLSQEMKDNILNYMNNTQALAEKYYQKHLADEDTPQHKKYLNMYRHTMTSLTGSKNAYSTLGIKVEYNWPNHYHKWILATQEDARQFLDAEVHPYPVNTDCIEEINTDDNGLLSFENVG